MPWDSWPTADPPPPYSWRAAHGYIPPAGAEPPSWNGYPSSWTAGIPLPPMRANGLPNFMPPYGPPSFYPWCNPEEAFTTPPPGRLGWPPYALVPPIPYGHPAGHCMHGPSQPRLPAAGGNTSAPHNLRPGIAQLYPASATTIHLLCPEHDSRHFLHQLTTRRGVRLPTFTPTSVDAAMKVRDYMKKYYGKSNGWAVTEVYERGNGRWGRGVTVKYNDFSMSDMKLEEFGWDGARGTGDARNVWLVLHEE